MMRYQAAAAMAMWCAVLHGGVQIVQGADSTEKKKNLAVMTLKNGTGISPSEAELITDRLGVELFNTGRVNVMERNQMQEILKEQGFQQSGACTDEACLVEMGQILGVQFLVSGSIGKLGSMYMVNLRVINVTTAEIANVVSEDITGGIEQVVGRLPAIARQLVTPSVPSASQTATAPKVKEEKPSPPPSSAQEKPAVKPVEEAAPVPVAAGQSPSSPPPSVPDKRAERNKNRGGLRLMGTFLLGTPKGAIDHEVVQGDHFRKKEDMYEKMKNYSHDVEHARGSVAAQLVFMIPAGRFIAIDAGAGLRYFADMWELQSYYDHVDDQLRIVTPHLTTGIAFVLRFFPGKLNVGMVADLGLNLIHYTFTYYDTTAYGTFERDRDNSWEDRAVRFNVAFGPRIGMEILGGPHFGFAIEFSYRFSRITTDVNLWGKNDDATYEFRMPGLGLAAGFNFYF